MSDLLISQNEQSDTPRIRQDTPQADGGQPDGQDSAHTHQRSKGPSIPSEEECLAAIAQVGRLVAIGLLKPAQANAIRGSFREILMYHQKKAKESEQGISNVDVLEVFQQDPKLLSLLEPLLSQEQIDMILKNSGGDKAQPAS